MDLFLETFERRPDWCGTSRPSSSRWWRRTATRWSSTAPTTSATMHADQTKVRQALFNLLSNAAKFTDHGTISLTVEREPDDWLTFAVVGHRIGMTEEQLGRLFEAFSQAEASTGASTAGPGWGWRSAATSAA